MVHSVGADDPPLTSAPQDAVTSNRAAVFATATPYAWELVETLWRVGVAPICVDNLGGADPSLPGLCLTLPPGAMNVHIGTSSVAGRTGAAFAAHAAGGITFPELVDPTAVVARTATVGHGAYVNAQATVGAKAELGCFVNVNRAASVGHHCRLGAFTCTGPAATLSGSVTTGAGVFVGSGAVVLPDLVLGAGSVVGAGAVVTRDVPEGAVVVGNPARIVRRVEGVLDSPGCPLC